MTNDPLPPMEWDIDVHLLTNRYMIAAMAKVMLGASLVVAALIGLLLGIQGDWAAALSMAGVMLAIGCGLFVLSLLVMALFFRNAIATRYALDDKGMRMTVIDRKARAGNRIAFWGGLVLGKPGAMGAGALAVAQEQQWFGWNGAFTASYEPATRSIALRNGWRTLARIYCLPGNYDQAVALVLRALSDNATPTRVPARSPLGRYLLRTVLVVGCSLPLFGLASELDLSLFMPLILLCFALATVWFVPPMAWAVLGALLIIFVEVALRLMEHHRSMFTGEIFRHYEVMSGDDWAMMALTGIAVAMLVWGAVATLRGRLTPALTQDWSDAGNG